MFIVIKITGWSAFGVDLVRELQYATVLGELLVDRGGVVAGNLDDLGAVLSALAVMTASMPPAAPSVCPVPPLVEEMASFFAPSSPKTDLRARVSNLSLYAVEVP